MGKTSLGVLSKLGPALQQADTLPSELRRTLTDLLRTLTELRRTLRSYVAP